MQIFAHLDISKKKGTKYRQAEGENSKKLLTVIDVDIAAVVADQPNPILILFTVFPRRYITFILANIQGSE